MRWNDIPSPQGLEGTQLLGLGAPEVLVQPSLALLSSAKAPAGILLAIQDIAQHWRRQGPVIWSGFQSLVENEALVVLLRGPQPAVIWLARGPLERLPESYVQPLAEGRLLIVTAFSESVRRATVETAQQRNLMLGRAADALLVAHAGLGSKTYSVTVEMFGSGRQVYTIEHSANQKLKEMGAQVYSTASAKTD